MGKVKVTEILNPNQARVECPTCGRETIYQRVTSKSSDYFYCSLDFMRTHTVHPNKILPSPQPEPKPTVVAEPPKEPAEKDTGIVEIDRLGFKSRAVDRVPDPENYRNGAAKNSDSSNGSENYAPQLRQGTDLHDMQAKMEHDAGLWQDRRARRPLTDSKGDAPPPQ